MKLDRNITKSKRGKYALIKLRPTDEIPGPISLNVEVFVDGIHCTPIRTTAIDCGNTDDTDFFVIRLKDKFAYAALFAYAKEAEKDDPEYAQDIFELATKAKMHPNKKMPD